MEVMWSLLEFRVFTGVWYRANSVQSANESSSRRFLLWRWWCYCEDEQGFPGLVAVQYSQHSYEALGFSLFSLSLHLSISLYLSLLLHFFFLPRARLGALAMAPLYVKENRTPRLHQEWTKERTNGRTNENALGGRFFLNKIAAASADVARGRRSERREGSRGSSGKRDRRDAKRDPL